MNDSQKPIFSTEFLARYLADFQLNQITGLHEKVSVIRRWQQQEATGKLSAMNEIELKSRFINDIFGTVLGFNSDGSKQWALREELATEVDATRADAALGIFTIRDHEISNEIRIVIEAKGYGHDLDADQASGKRVSPVEQAFLYATKYGRHCRWVVVTNFQTIRFFHASYQGEWQQFKLSELSGDIQLQTFLFLFRQEMLLNRRLSPTDKLYEARTKTFGNDRQKLHILDELYNSLYRFDELPFIEPTFIANLYPFNVIGEQVWHYDRRMLYTLNPAVHHFLKEVEISERTITMTASAEQDLIAAGVVDAQQKLSYIVKRLNDCLVKKIVSFEDLEPIRRRNSGTIGFSLNIQFGFETGEGLIKDIHYKDEETCMSPPCLRNGLELDRLFRNLKIHEGDPAYVNLEEAYGNYVMSVDAYKRAYLVYKNVVSQAKGRADRAITYFLAQLNLSNLRHFLQEYDLDDREEILHELQDVDLDKVLYQDVEIFLDQDQINYLKRIRDKKVIVHVRDQLNVLVAIIKEERDKLAEGRTHWNQFPDHTAKLHYYHYILYAQHQANYIIGDILSDYADSVELYAEGLALSYKLPTTFKDFPSSLLLEFIWFVASAKLKQFFESIELINVNREQGEKFVTAVRNFLTSFFEIGFGHVTENRRIFGLLDNYSFNERAQRVFRNIFIFLSVIEAEDELLKTLNVPLINHLQICRSGYLPDVAALGIYIEKKGYLFSSSQLYEILSIFMKHQELHRSVFENLADSLSKAFQKFHPDFRISDRSIIQRTLANCSDSSGHNSFIHLLHLYKICNEGCRQVFKEAITNQLDLNFFYLLYEESLRNRILKPNEFGFFERLIRIVNGSKQFSYQGVPNEEIPFNNYLFVSFCFLLFDLEYRLSDSQRELFSEFTAYESWLISPETFNYRIFDARWLRDFEKTPQHLRRFGKIAPMADVIGAYLSTNYDEVLAKMYFEYFRGNFQ